MITSSAHGLADRAEAVADSAGLVACRIDSELGPDGLGRLREQLQAGSWDAAFVSARELGDPGIMEAARSMHPRLLVIDDAQCFSRHGHCHDPSFSHAVHLRADADCVLALSDLADRQARDEIMTGFDLREEAAIDLDLPWLRLEFRRTPGRTRKEAALLSMMVGRPSRAIVFAGSPEETRAVARLVEDRCDLASVVVTRNRGEEFAGAARRFREGSARVLISSDALEAQPRWPDVPLVVICSLPRSPEMLHRQARMATGEGSRAVLLYDRSQHDELVLDCMRCGPEAGHLLAIHAGFAKEARVDYAALHTATGLPPDDLHIGVEMLSRAGALAVRARGDDWVEADTADRLHAQALTACARECHLLRAARLEQAAQVLAIARTRGCRREALAAALGYETVEDTRCLCDRCDPAAGELC